VPSESVMPNIEAAGSEFPVISDLGGRMPVGTPPHCLAGTTSTSIRWNSFPSRLYCKGKRLSWEPEAIDFSQDVKDWQNLTRTQRQMILQMLAIFAEGEGAVTAHLAPMMIHLSREGHREDELYLTQFLYEEAKHVEAFDRFRCAVCPHEDVVRHQTPSSRFLFDEEMPRVMNHLLRESSPRALADAAATYNMIIEGVVAETGYFTWRGMLTERGIFPGMLKIILHVSTDEARHIAFGVYLLNRLIRQDPSLLPVTRKRMRALLGHALRMQQEIFSNFPEGTNFELRPMRSIDFALRQFNNRLQALERAVDFDDIESFSVS